jgi:nucleoside-diphosphate-sugar epimerase
MSDQDTVAITGANGYVGGVLRAAFLAAGYRVIRLQRSRPADAASEDHIYYTLESGPAQRLPDCVRAVVHCAYDLTLRNPIDIERVNLGGFRRLIESIEPTRIVHISSMSAYAGTDQIYGRTKLACEELTTAGHGTSLRLGLVYGGADGGMIGALQKLSRLPVVPRLRPDSYQYTVQADDMARCVLSTVQQSPPHSVLGVANPRRVPFSEIMETLRNAAGHKRARNVTVPSAYLYRALRAVEAGGLKIGFRADSMLGLMHPAQEVPHAGFWAERGISIRDFTIDEDAG